MFSSSPQNPTKGVLINHPNGTNVYDGVVLDYTGPFVTASNFLNVLRGDKFHMQFFGTGKVNLLKTNDNNNNDINDDETLEEKLIHV